MKKNEQDKLYKKKAYAFLTVIALATIIFIIVIFAMIAKSVKFKGYSDIARKNLTILGQDMFCLQDGDYYIFIYSSNYNNEKINMEKQDALEPYIANYFTFVKQNKRKNGVCEIRLLDIEESKNQRCLSTYTTSSASKWSEFYVDEASLPMLVYLTVSSAGNNQYNYSYETYAVEGDIKTKLANSISLVVNVAYIPSKKESMYC